MADIENALERNRQYWKKRFSAVEAMNHNRAEKAVSKITPAFDRAQKQIQKEIESWYHRFADNNEISLTEAKRLLKGKDLEELKWDIDEYIKRGKEYGISGAWAKELENASARYHISRLEALQLRCQQAAEEAFGNELDELDDFLSKAYTEGYYHTAFEIQKGLGIGYDIGTIDKNKVRRVLEKPWTADGKTFSDRIWTSKTQLLDSVDKELTQMCILGKAPDQAIENIAKRMNVSKNQAGRLVMTESAYIASAAQKDCFNDLDVEEYEIVATLDGHTSEICREMDGKHFPMKDFQPGVTAPPFHVWCRSCTCPYFDDEFTENEIRAARGEDGKTYQVPADMKYPEWKKAFVDGGIQAEEVTLESLENEFMKLTEGYSYDEFMKDFGSIEEGFEGSTTAEIQKAKEISSKIEELKKAILPEATISRTLSAEERFQNIGISFSNSAKTDIPNNISDKYADFVTTFESEHPAYFNKNTVPLKSVEIVDDIKGMRASGIYKQSEKKIQVKASAIKSNLKITSHSDDFEMHSFVHEYGHYISDSLEANAGITEADIVQRSINRYFDGDIFKGTKDLKDILSSYGSTSYQEAFAEAFAEAYTSKEPRRFAKIFKVSVVKVTSTLYE